MPLIRLVSSAAAIAIALALGMLSLAAPEAAAQTGSVPQPGAAPAERRIYDGDDFRAAFEGRTVELVDRLGRFYGAEQYFPGDRTIWVADDGGCVDGVWYMRDGYVCFEYPQSGPHCWLVFEEGPDTFVLSDGGLLLRVSEVHDRALQCEPELLSRAAPWSPRG